MLATLVVTGSEARASALARDFDLSLRLEQAYFSWVDGVRSSASYRVSMAEPAGKSAAIFARLAGGYQEGALLTFALDDALIADRASLLRRTFRHEVELGMRRRLGGPHELELSAQAEIFDSAALRDSSTSFAAGGTVTARISDSCRLRASLHGVYKQFPNMTTATSSVDHRELRQRTQLRFQRKLGARKGRRSQQTITWSVESELRLRGYVRSHHDALDTDSDSASTIVRDPENRQYRAAAIATAVTYELRRRLTATSAARWEQNRSRHYDRFFADAGILVRSYYDYDHFELKEKAELELIPALSLELEGAVGWRRFANYPARAEDGSWLGERRRDRELKASVALGLDLDRRLRWSGKLRLEAFVEHRLERSNMRDERSFLTSYELTTVGLRARFGV